MISRSARRFARPGVGLAKRGQSDACGKLVTHAFFHAGAKGSSNSRLFLEAACIAGCRQVVLLAAVYDTRAFRLVWAPTTRLFDPDMAEVLAFKERVLSAHGATPTSKRVLIPAGTAGTQL